MDPLSIIGAVVTIVDLITVGSELTKLLFAVGSSLGSAGQEVRDLGIDISLLCAVLRQLQIALDRSRQDSDRPRPARRVSGSAINTTQEVLERCKEIFGKIEQVILGLGVHTHEGEEVGEKREGKDEGLIPGDLDFSARIKWTLKRGKVATYRATLESCKVTLVLMVTTFAYADQVAERRDLDKVNAEDLEAEKLAQTLTAAQRHAIERVRTLELEDEDEEAETAPQATSKASIKTPASEEGTVAPVKGSTLDGKSKNKSSDTMKTARTWPPDGKSPRAAEWLANLLELEDPSGPFSSQESQESSKSAPVLGCHQLNLFLEKFTEESKAGL